MKTAILELTGDDPIEALRRLDIFRGLTDGEYKRIGAAAKVVRLPQDRVLPRGGADDAPRAFLFLVRGQVAFAEFAMGSVPRGPINPKKRATPLMQLSERNVALFEPNDFFANDHVDAARGSDGVKREMALYTCVPVVMLEIQRDAMDKLLEGLPEVKSRVEARAEESYYRQTFLKLDHRSEVLDFYVKQGFEYATAIKVIQTDKCIDCDACIMGCEERHGVSRIERFGPKLGLVQFTQNCRTCEDARCLDPCKFDAIGFDQKINEVVVYDNCVGCTLCAKACPHDAIRMVDIIEPEIDIVAMVADQNAKPRTVIADGEEDPAKKKKKAKRIANKCDHCLGYSDMACISACPTGAIVQIDPRVLFRRDGGLIEKAEKYFDARPFERGYAEVVGGQGVTLFRTLFVTVGLFVLGCVWEFIARKAFPELSLWRQLVSLVLGPASASSLMLTYSAVSGLGRWMGYLGAGMMTVAALYTLRLHLPGLRRAGSSKTWFDLHIVFGVAGPILSLLHTNLNIFTWYWVTFLWWAVFLVVVTGLIGRYLYTMVPRFEAGVERDKKQLDEGIKIAADQWASMTTTANVMQHFLKAQEKTADREREEGAIGGFSLIFWLIQSRIREVRGIWALRSGLLSKMQNDKLRTTAIALMRQRARVERKSKMIGVARPLLAQWRVIHIGVTVVMFVLLIVHASISIWALGL